MASTQVPAVISYHKPGTRPPLYVAGTFSQPPWEPYEMDHKEREDGEYDFKKEVCAEPGTKIEYKFRLGNGDWWVLKEDGPTVTDSSGNTNHVLEVKPQEEDAEKPQDTGEDSSPSYAKVAAKRLQPSGEAAGSDRSGTGTPISARVAAEVADSAELLHEEVPDREKPAGVAQSSKAQEPASDSMSETAETAAEVADTAERLDSSQDTFVILEPPPGEGRPFKVQFRGEEFGEYQEESIADKSPLFAHECVGMFNLEDSGEVVFSEDDEEEDYHAAPTEEIDYDNIDLNDPTLERFPSARDDIIDAVRKIETGLEADQASFDGYAPSPVVNPSRRGTEDITGDFLLTAPQVLSPSQRALKKSPRGSIGSIPAVSLHSISEAEEPVVDEEEEEEEEEDEEEQASPKPAVVFSNPLKSKPKHLKLPSSEDEGVALPDGISPRTVKPNKPIVTPEQTPPHSPASPRTARRSHLPALESVALAETELAKHKERSMQTVKVHPPVNVQAEDKGQTGNPKPATENSPGNGEGPSYAKVTALEPPKKEDSGETKPTTAPPATEEANPDKETTPQVDGPRDTKKTDQAPASSPSDENKHTAPILPPPPAAPATPKS
ncbi:hypothetical protein N0V88_002049 [Collariella sp. IMI 366227]|nr:hypothetical protein N0V88_002049 [Collariella sp. IMI 366227]